MRFEGALVQHFVFFLSDLESFFVCFVTLKFSSHFIFHVVSSDGLIFHRDTIELALINQSVVLIISDLSFRSSFKLFPCLLLNHCSVCIHILSLQSDLFQLLGQPGILFLFILLLFIYLFICFNETLLTNLFLLLVQLLLGPQFLLSLLVICNFPLVSGLLNFGSSAQELFRCCIFPCKIFLPLLLSFLFELPLVEFNSLSELGNRHFFE